MPAGQPAALGQASILCTVAAAFELPELTWGHLEVTGASGPARAGIGEVFGEPDQVDFLVPADTAEEKPVAAGASPADVEASLSVTTYVCRRVVLRAARGSNLEIPSQLGKALFQSPGMLLR